MAASPLILLLIVSAILFIGFIVSSIWKSKYKQALWSTIIYFSLIGLSKTLYYYLGIYYAIIAPVIICLILLFITDPSKKNTQENNTLDN